MDLDPHFKHELDERLSSLSPYPKSNFSGFGLVICAGGASYFTNAYVLVNVLRRHLKCTLPIEVWHIGRREMSPRMKLILEDLDVQVVDATVEMSARGAIIEGGWQLKPFAVMWSRFERVLLLDADQVPVRDPVYMAHCPQFQKSGAVLWPDVLDLLAENPIWEACGLASRRMNSVESGQLLIDKSRKWEALQVALHINERARYYYSMIYGDKDTFLIAMLLTNSPFSLVPHAPATDRGLCLYQHDFEGELLFQHRTGAKWRYLGAQEHLPGFIGGQACDLALEELRRKWNGLIFHPPVRSEEAQHAVARQSGSDGLIFVVPGQQPVRLELLAAGEIGEGRAADRMNWCCEEVVGEIHLRLFDAFGETWRLKQKGGGRWYGNSVIDPEIEAFLGGEISNDQDVRHAAREGWAKWPMPGRYSDGEEMDFS